MEVVIEGRYMCKFLYKDLTSNWEFTFGFENMGVSAWSLLVDGEGRSGVGSW